ncbi:hypothetical protein CDAR_4591 [Caerostris darwini]|uniref:Uncharacterized protein n=1 Tax=Caerostris darwini TaxID=1538125 RepID=A0AAV4SJZ3_9ARAC|nr:hypothetical protein CDAR_4591 [Caerostris darwini]
MQVTPKKYFDLFTSLILHSLEARRHKSPSLAGPFLVIFPSKQQEKKKAYISLFSSQNAQMLLVEGGMELTFFSSEAPTGGLEQSELSIGDLRIDFCIVSFAREMCQEGLSPVLEERHFQVD